MAVAWILFSVERLSSVPGNVQNPRRTRFCPNFSQNLLFLKYHSEIFEYFENQIF